MYRYKFSLSYFNKTCDFFLKGNLRFEDVASRNILPGQFVFSILQEDVLILKQNI